MLISLLCRASYAMLVAYIDAATLMLRRYADAPPLFADDAAAFAMLARY